MPASHRPKPISTSSNDRLTLALGCAAQLAVSGLSLAFSPWILRTVGAEAYGLVGLFLVAFAWFSLLDAGLTPALTREAARLRGGATTGGAFARALRGMEWLVALVAVPLLLLVLLLARPLGLNWIDADTLPARDVVVSINLMALILLLRWYSGVRRGVLVGFEHHRTLHLWSVTSAGLRFPGLMLWFLWVAPGAISYFVWQLLVSLLEVVVLIVVSQRVGLARIRATPLQAIGSLRGVAGFAASHSAVALLRVLITQTDKLVLVRVLPLATFGYFSLAAAAAAGVHLIVLPINQMLMPRLSRLVAQGQQDQVRQQYRMATRGTMVLVATAGGVLSCFGQPVMQAWTGDVEIARLTGSVLSLYTLGNVAMAAAGFSYYLQYAQGTLRLHTLGSLGFLILVAPALYAAALQAGMVGAGLVWVVSWTLYLCTWVTFTHRRFLNGMHWQWLFGDVLRPVLPVLAAGYALSLLTPWPSARWALAAVLVGYGLLFLLLSALCAGLLSARQWRALRGRTG